MLSRNALTTVTATRFSPGLTPIATSQTVPRESAGIQSPTRPASVGVVIACFSQERLAMILRVVAAARRQTLPPRAIVVVVDHNEALYRDLQQALPADVTLIDNARARGAGGARNSGAALLDTDLVAFVDDDALPAPDWLQRLGAHLDDPDLVGVGGSIHPSWATAEPRWFPRECGWVIGWREGDLPTLVRNVWSASMIVDRAAFAAAGGFRDAFGKVGDASEPEDTELCIRLSRQTGRHWLFDPTARVTHYVSEQHASLGFFLRRSWLEGQGKARLYACSDHSQAVLADEMAFLRALPSGVARNLGAAVRGDLMGIGRAALLLGGTGVTCLGYVCALLRRSPRSTR